MRRQALPCVVGLCFALGAANAYAGDVGRGAVVRTVSDRDVGPAIHDLGVAAPTANSEEPTPAPASTMSSADATPVPELPVWAMMLLCFVGLGVAGFKRGRKDRLSPGIE
jgi:hypothetical protein